MEQETLALLLKLCCNKQVLTGYASGPVVAATDSILAAIQN
jgi:hypothetical protein